MVKSENMTWKTGNVPKDGRRIIRWMKYWRCALCVYYREGVSEDKACVWITSDSSNSYPEESFIPDVWIIQPREPEV